MNIIKYCRQAFPMKLSTLVKRDPNVWIFGAWFGEKYSDNSKALYEYSLKSYPNKKIFWLTRNIKIYNALKKKGFPVLMIRSFKGIYYQLKAKVVFYCTGVCDVTDRLLGHAIHINLWHGVGGGKKIGFDAHWYDDQYEKFLFNLYKKYFPKSYMICTSEEMKRIFLNAFHISEKRCIMAGQPRNDIFFVQNYKIKTFDIKVLKGKKVITYLPTHRMEGRRKIKCNKLFDLSRMNDFCQKNNCIFIIKKHYYHKEELENLEQYKNIIDFTRLQQIDTNELLLKSDYVISDYSSVTADFLLLNRPLFYYCYDLEEYLAEDRDLYWPYDEITPGPKCRSFDELFLSLQCVIEGNEDKYLKDRQRVLDLFYGLHARKQVCQDILDVVENIVSNK